jgi:serine/threonine protein phosphatase PrpC
LLQISVGSFATPGSRGADRMEDRHTLACPMERSCPEAHLMAVFDGHRGAEAAQFAADNLEDKLRDAWGATSAEAALKVLYLYIWIVCMLMPHPDQPA